MILSRSLILNLPTDGISPSLRDTYCDQLCQWKGAQAAVSPPGSSQVKHCRGVFHRAITSLAKKVSVITAK